MPSIPDLVRVLRSYKGYREGPNNATKFGSWIGAPNAAWCDSFVHFGAYEVGFRFPGSQFGDKGDASVGYTIGWHKARGLWSPSPVDGSFVTYDWGGRGNWLEYHIELLIAHDATRNLVIGGNVGDTVVEQWRSRFAVTGYCILPGAVIPPPIVAPLPVPPELEAYLMGEQGVAVDAITNPNKPGSGYRLDRSGGIHAFGGAPPVRMNHAGWPGSDVARRLVLLRWNPDGAFVGYVLDKTGDLHPVNGAPGVPPAPAEWEGGAADRIRP